MNTVESLGMLSRRGYHQIARRMLGHATLPDSQYTFTNLMQELCTETPDVYAFTENSAIPIADAIRAYHEELQLPQPVLTGVRANRTISRELDSTQADAIFSEACRLEPVVRGKSTLLIDQFVGTGGTLRLGMAMLRSAGAKRIKANSSIKWYDQAVRSEVDNQNLTSEHADFMREIGAKAARSFVTRN